MLVIRKLGEFRSFECALSKNGWFTFVERNERVQSTEDLSQFTLCHDVQLQHGLIIHLQEQKEKKKSLEEEEIWQDGKMCQQTCITRIYSGVSTVYS